MPYFSFGSMVTVLTLWAAVVSFAGDYQAPATTDASRSSAEAQQLAASTLADIVWEEANANLDLFTPTIANVTGSPVSTDDKTSGQ